MIRANVRRDNTIYFVIYRNAYYVLISKYVSWLSLIIYIELSYEKSVLP